MEYSRECHPTTPPAPALELEPLPAALRRARRLNLAMFTAERPPRPRASGSGGSVNCLRDLYFIVYPYPDAGVLFFNIFEYNARSFAVLNWLRIIYCACITLPGLSHLLRCIPILRHCDTFVTNFTAAKFRALYCNSLVMVMHTARPPIERVVADIAPRGPTPFTTSELRLLVDADENFDATTGLLEESRLLTLHLTPDNCSRQSAAQAVADRVKRSRGSSKSSLYLTSLPPWPRRFGRWGRGEYNVTHHLMLRRDTNSGQLRALGTTSISVQVAAGRPPPPPRVRAVRRQKISAGENAPARAVIVNNGRLEYFNETRRGQNLKCSPCHAPPRPAARKLIRECARRSL
ncbi:hypothetical protein EVAR_37918_1 [Eumeta japonica]|uniref:Uncharacterized protein n=1 Tax=Eumeta variegata TaxID=151549 RepID=A0A4C1XD86_EUMVA|nr:hypothetical protein EVAR_37918_1 [Eumeta japonica]